MDAADPQEIAQLAQQWTEGQRRCRARQRHNWNPLTVVLHQGAGGSYYEVVEQCGHCKNRRQREMDLSGFWLTKWRMLRYSENYLLPKGTGYIDNEGRAGLRLADILSRKIVEVNDDVE